MHSVENLRVKRLCDIESGNLIAIQQGNESRFALRVSLPYAVPKAPDQPAALILRPTLVDHKSTPFVMASNQYCLDFGCRPTFTWSPLETEHCNPQQSGSVGHLAVCRDCIAISGGLGSWANYVTAYWDLITGSPVEFPDSSTTIYIGKWQMGIFDIEGNFTTLETFPLHPKNTFQQSVTG